jgi:hypothetical protein
MASDGRLVGQGNLQQHSSVQHSITVPAMRNVGSYLLQVEMDNGELKSIPFLRK